MYTSCPKCRTFFSLGAAQLRAARGQVRCGNCLEIFDGLQFLTDDAFDGHRAESPPLGTGDASLLPEQWSEAGQPARPAEASKGDAAAGPASPPVLEASTHSNLDEQVPEVLKEDIARAEVERRSRANSWIFTTAAVLLLAGLALQYAWFKPAGLLAAYPQARAWLEALCTRTGCSLPDRRDPSKIQMLARDVRVHPGYEGALLVSATLVNVAPHAQPYPLMQFNVFNVNGQTIASRVFEPKEFLSADVNADGEMSPRKPLQIAIEMIAPEEAAVSYEFRFL
jgi:predicted Zn finger-like uncharacterized protein